MRSEKQTCILSGGNMAFHDLAFCPLPHARRPARVAWPEGSHRSEGAVKLEVEGLGMKQFCGKYIMLVGELDWPDSREGSNRS